MEQNNRTMDGGAAAKLAKHGRFGDTEMAHVTPGEQIIPNSMQTPQVMGAVKQEFDRQGVPMDRYRVGSTQNSKNPDSGKGEYFLDKLIEIGAPIVGGMIGGPAGAAIGSSLAGAINGGDEVQGGAMPTAQSNLPAPVEAAQNQAPAKDYLQGIQYAPITGSHMESSDPAQATLNNTQRTEVANMDPSVAALMGVMPVSGAFNSMNPTSGAPEFYDTRMKSNSAHNPATGHQEFADPWSTETNQKLLDQYLGEGTVQAGSGGGEAALANADKATRDAYTAARREYNPDYTTGYDSGKVQSTTMSGAGINKADNQALKRDAGYTGGFEDRNEFQNWSANNSQGYLDYLQGGKKFENFANPVDLDPLKDGQQTFSRDLNNYLGTTVGWNGQVGSDQLGSGKEGIDYLSQNREQIDTYEKQRQLTDPNYKWTSKTVLPDDFNSDQYLKNNPTAAARVAAGDEYTGAGQYYNQNGGSYQQPEKPSWYTDLMTQLEKQSQPAAQESQPTSNANIQNVSTLSPVRSPRFRSNRYSGSYARSF